MTLLNMKNKDLSLHKHELLVNLCVSPKMCSSKFWGERVMTRDFERQKTELQMRVAILNSFTHLGKPLTERVFYK